MAKRKYPCEAVQIGQTSGLIAVVSVLTPSQYESCCCLPAHRIEFQISDFPMPPKKCATWRAQTDHLVFDKKLLAKAKRLLGGLNYRQWKRLAPTMGWLEEAE